MNYDVRGEQSGAPHSRQEQNYVSDIVQMRPDYREMQLGGDLRTKYTFPTRFEGRFARAMSSMAQSPARSTTGKVASQHLDDNFQTEVSQALALKLDLKTRQHANDKMLGRLIQSGGECSSLKQAVQARAAIYGEVGDPS